MFETILEKFLLVITVILFLICIYLYKLVNKLRKPKFLINETYNSNTGQPPPHIINNFPLPTPEEINGKLEGFKNRADNLNSEINKSIEILEDLQEVPSDNQIQEIDNENDVTDNQPKIPKNNQINMLLGSLTSFLGNPGDSSELLTQMVQNSNSMPSLVIESDEDEDEDEETDEDEDEDETKKEPVVLYNNINNNW